MYIFVKCTSIPRPTEMSFTDFFVCTTSEQNVNETTRIRNEMSRTLSGDFTQIQKKLSIEKYLPYVFALQSSIKTGTVSLKKGILYKWTSFLNSGKHVFENPQINFEVTMTLAAYAFTLANCAIATANEFFQTEAYSSNPLTPEKISENAKECSQYFRRAAGVVEYLQNAVIPLLSPAHGLLPVECSVHMMGALKEIFLAQAQVFAVMLGADQQNNPVTLARLCMGISKRFDRGHQLMKINTSDYKALLPSLPVLLDLLPKHYDSLAYRHLADSEMNKEVKDCGAACCYALESIKLNEAILPIRTQDEVKKIIERIHDMNAKLIEKLNYDNQHIYFQPVPTFPPSALPDPAEITKAIEFVVPDPVYTEIK